MSESNQKESVGFVKRGLVDYDTSYWHTRIIAQGWQVLAALAWDGWQAVGRGAVIVSYYQAYDPGPSEPYFSLRVQYVEQGDIPKDEDGPRVIDQTTETLSSWLERYEPEKEFIVGIERSDGETADYRVAESVAGVTPTPEESYRIFIDGGCPLPEWISMAVVDAALDAKLMAEESDSESFA